MERIIIIGCSGAGKSTLSRKLASLLNLPLYHLDKLYWKPGWVEPDKNEWLKIIKEHTAKDKWVMDGNYINTMEVRIERADTVLYFDFTTWFCLYRVLRRIWAKKERPDMAEGCYERLDFKFLAWIASFRKHTTPRIEKILEKNKSTKKIFTLHNKKEVDKFMKELEQNISKT